MVWTVCSFLFYFLPVFYSYVGFYKCNTSLSFSLCQCAVLWSINVAMNLSHSHALELIKGQTQTWVCKYTHKQWIYSTVLSHLACLCHSSLNKIMFILQKTCYLHQTLCFKRILKVETTLIMWLFGCSDAFSYSRLLCREKYK